MNFNFSAKELLALHNLLLVSTKFESMKDDRVILSNVYDRVRFYLLSALKNNGSDQIANWMKSEQQKIDKLILESKTEERDTDPDSLKEEILQEDFSTVVYPRRSHVSRQRQNKNKK